MTRAGAHDAPAHVTVMAEETVGLLAVRPGGVWVDATLGGGGHAALMLERSAPDGTVIGMDLDAAAVERAARRFKRQGARFRAVQGNFAEAQMVLERTGLGRAHGVAADLGMSSDQLADPRRGFSFGAAGPLDMRMDAAGGPTALEFLDRADERELARVIGTYGGERNARGVARAIKTWLASGGDRDTVALAAAVSGAAWKGGRLHPATKTFMAIRMAVNREPQSLQALLNALPSILGPGGRAAVIAFNSVEDRTVKRAFADLARGCVCPPDLPVCACGRRPRATLLTSGPITPAAAEIAANPRARSARLRAIELH